MPDPDQNIPEILTDRRFVPNTPPPPPPSGIDVSALSDAIQKVEETQSGRWIKVVSSNLTRVRYLSEELRMEVEFNSGAIYAYGGVSLPEFDAMLNAESVGKEFHKIKKKASFKQVEGPWQPPK
jgi:hypothetical protein